MPIPDLSKVAEGAARRLVMGSKFGGADSSEKLNANLAAQGANNPQTGMSDREIKQYQRPGIRTRGGNLFQPDTSPNYSIHDVAPMDQQK